jgi:hypothetical protein
LPESAKFKNVQALRADPSLLKKGLMPADPAPDARDVEETDGRSSPDSPSTSTDPEKIEKAPKAKKIVAAVVPAKKEHAFSEVMECVRAVPR